jgi:hypothetical protein
MVRKWLSRFSIATSREVRNGRAVLVLDGEALSSSLARARVLSLPSSPTISPLVHVSSVLPVDSKRREDFERELETARELARVQALLVASEKAEARLNAYADKLEDKLEKSHAELRRLERLVGQISGQRDALLERPAWWARLFRL